MPAGFVRLILAGLLFIGAVVLFPVTIVYRETTGPVTSPPRKMQAAQDYGRLPLMFEPADAQPGGGAGFVARRRDFSLYVSPTQAIISLQNSRNTSLKNGPHAGAAQKHQRQHDQVRMRLVGASARARMRGTQLLTGKVNYIIGNDPVKWRTNLPTYAGVECDEVYRGVDLVYYGNQQQLEYDLRVAAGTNPGAIRLQMSGAERIRINTRGALEFQIGDGTSLELERPKAYQDVHGQRYDVDAQYALDENHTIGFSLGKYDSALPLVIDPALVYSTYLGGNGDDYAGSIAVDATGHAYVAGVTASPDFPATPGALQPAAGGAQDAFVAKLSPDGKSLIYCTYLGGNADDAAFSLAIDTTGHAYVAGITASTNFPTTPGAYQTAPGGGPDGFVTKLSPDGKSLVYSTYLGGNAWDQIYAVAVDPQGRAYVAGFTSSPNFPTSAGAFQTVLSAGASDAFVAKLSADGKSLLFGTYLGGNGDDAAYSLAVDATGHAYAAGYTNSANFPVTMGAYQTSPHGGQDAFAAKLNPDGKSLAYSTFLGGTSDDAAYAIAVDAGGRAYIAGFTYSSDFPATPGAAQPLFGGGSSDAFVAKLSADGSALVYSTYLGGNGDDNGNALSVDRAGRAYVAGFTSSMNFPVTPGAYQSAFNGGPFDAFVAGLTADGKSIVYGTYLGGNAADYINSIATDSLGNAYVAGITYSTNFPTTPGSIQPGPRVVQDAFITKLNVGRPAPAAAAPAPVHPSTNTHSSR